MAESSSSSSPNTPSPPIRKRKAHKKSRAGCRNCKLRRVKCDETRPTCNTCDRFMVHCNYDGGKQDDLEVCNSKTGNFFGGPRIMDPMSVNDALLSMINTTLRASYPPEYETLQLALPDLERLKRWQTRTVMTIGSYETALVYQKAVIKLVPRFPYLMHSVLALTIKHDRHITPDDPEDGERQTLEFYHFGRAAALFNLKLATHTDRSGALENDALWSCAVFMGNLAMSSVDGDSPEDVWPLKNGTSGEALSWLRISEGLIVLWMFSEPYAPGRIFHEMVGKPEHTYMRTKFESNTKPGIEGVPQEIVALCGLDESSDAINNPYQTAVRKLVPLIDFEYNEDTILKFLSFTVMMDERYKVLLQAKDPAALVLLSWWYARVTESRWFIARRALLECRSICIYLEKNYPDDALVQKMLRFPRKQTGLPEMPEPKAFKKDEWRVPVISRVRGGYQHVGSWV